MAMIQKIRDNSLLTLIVIGGAVFAFILTDFLSSSPGTKSTTLLVHSKVLKYQMMTLGLSVKKSFS